MKQHVSHDVTQRVKQQLQLHGHCCTSSSVNGVQWSAEVAPPAVGHGPAPCHPSYPVTQVPIGVTVSVFLVVTRSNASDYRSNTATRNSIHLRLCRQTKNNATWILSLVQCVVPHCSTYTCPQYGHYRTAITSSQCAEGSSGLADQCAALSMNQETADT